MSGGHFDYIQYRFQEVIDSIEELIQNNGKEKPEDLRDRWDNDIYYHKYSDDVIEEFKRGLEIIKKAQIYTHRIDYLVSGDDSEKSFHERLKEDLEETFKTI